MILNSDLKIIKLETRIKSQDHPKKKKITRKSYIIISPKFKRHFNPLFPSIRPLTNTEEQSLFVDFNKQSSSCTLHQLVWNGCEE